MALQPLTRRSLLSGSAVAAAAAVVGYVVARNSNAATGTSTGGANSYGATGSGGDVLTSVSSITGNGIVTHGVVHTRDSSGGVHAVSATCTHQGCTVGAPQGGVVSCPCHGSQFNAVSGQVIRGPATRPLPAVAVHVQGTNVVRG